MRLAFALAAAALLCGCTTSGQPLGPSDYDLLARKCQDRGGYLTPIPGANNANVAANYYCNISGTAASH